MAEEQSLWNYDRIESLIGNQVEESLSLEYKAAGALGKQNSQKTEITKDIAALANSAGGVLIYGIREYDSKEKAHLPEAIDPVSRADFPKEWLEHVVQNIRPKIDNLLIHPVAIPSLPDRVVYVVEVLQSSTAHQSLDYRYYRRFNFESVPMQDYEIRDVMARRQHPVVELDFYLLYEDHITFSPVPGYGEEILDTYRLCIIAQNNGPRLAKYVVANVLIPSGILSHHATEGRENVVEQGHNYHRFCLKNLVRDVIGGQQGGLMEVVPKYGQHRFEPILPTLSLEFDQFDLDVPGYKSAMKDGRSVHWETYADDAPKRFGAVALGEIKPVDRRDLKGESEFDQ